MGKSLPSRVGGPLGPFAVGFWVELRERGYEWTAVHARMRLVAELSAWIGARGIEPRQVTVSVVAEFLEAARVADSGKPWCSPTSESQLVVYLRDVGVVAAPEPSVVTDPVELLVGEFVEYLARERGLVPGTRYVHEYKRVARLFLSGRFAPDGGGLDRLTAGEVTAFVLAECRRRSYRMCWALVSSLRGLLRFLFLEGLTSVDLRGAVPGVARWRAQSLPRALSAEHVARILASCDRTSAVGRRDFAILMMLSRLGLRAGEVANLRLSDIDWRAGELIIRGKGDRFERMPLPADVGEAVVDYLRDGRPARPDPHLFLRSRAPFTPLTGGAGAIGQLVHSAYVRAGLAPAGAHALPHTVATGALRAGAPLEEIASLLRHRRHATTVIYAKVDWERLRELARPWPGSLS